MSFTRLSNKVSGWIAITAAVGLGVVAISGTQGCTITTDSGNDGGFDGFDANTGDTGTTKPDSGVPFNPCNECLFGLCSGQYALCMQDTSANGCQAIYACTTKQGCDNNCVIACIAAGSDAAQRTYSALGNCDTAGECGQCQTACGVAASTCPTPDAGTDAPTTDGAVVVTCDSCIASSCAAQKTTCAAGSECEKYTDCLGACADAACITKCGTDHAQGQTDANALGTCTSTNCASPCGL